jgi:PAS domain S-box-containing protein
MEILGVVTNLVIKGKFGLKIIMGDSIESLREKIALLENEVARLYIDKTQQDLVISSTGVGIWDWQVQTGQTQFNERWADIIGYHLDELQPVSIHTWLDHAHPDDLPESERLLKEHWAGKSDYYIFESRMRHKQGHWVWVLDTGQVIEWESEGVPKRMIGTHLDVTDKHRLMAELSSSQLRMQLANDAAGIGVWEWDLTTDQLIWDHQMFKLYGIEPNGFSGLFQAWQERIHSDDLKRIKDDLQRTIDGFKGFNSEFRIVRPDGSVRTIKANAKGLTDFTGKVVKVVGVNYDITDKVELVTTLARAKRDAEHAARAKSDFLSNMSHEIRTPMNAILGGLQLLEGAELDGELRQILENASFSANSLLTIINDILDFSKIESDMLELEKAPFSLREVLDSVTYDLDALVSFKRIDFVVSISDDFADGWLGDLVRVKQIVLNLASNAVKFTDNGKVEINTDMVNYRGKNAIQLHIIDSGVGMSAEVQQRIFDRFSQADTSTTRKYGGTGLGMSITTTLVKMMEGEMSLVSKENIGTDIRVILPLEQAKLKPRVERKQSLSPPDLRGKHILIVEDNKVNRILIEKMMLPCRGEITMVENGQLAVDAVKAVEFDLVLMDIHMPVMDGIDAQKVIRQYDHTIPVIALTANVMKEDVEKYLAQGFFSHIGKPVDLKNLYGVLAQFASSQEP